MIVELVGRKQNLIVAPSVINAPGVWTVDSRVPVAGLGALVTPLLGWHWDSEPAAFEQYPGVLAWASPRQQIERFFRRLRHSDPGVPLIAALAPDEPAALADAADVAEMQGARAVLLWDAPTPAHLSAVTAATLLPVLAEYPAGTEVPQLHNVAALLIGPPRLQMADMPARLWGPAIQPLVYQTAVSLPKQEYPVIITGIAADRQLATLPDGVDGRCIGPELWVNPDIRAES